MAEHEAMEREEHLGMIRNDREYKAAYEQLQTYQKLINEQREALSNEGFPPEQVERGVQPLISFASGLADEMEWYARAQRGQFDPVTNFVGLGRLLIALRINAGRTQRDLALLLGIPESQVSRDERNEYHGISKERARTIIEALGYDVTLTVTRQPGAEAPRSPRLSVAPDTIPVEELSNERR